MHLRGEGVKNISHFSTKRQNPTFFVLSLSVAKSSERYHSVAATAITTVSSQWCTIVWQIVAGELKITALKTLPKCIR